MTVLGVEGRYFGATKGEKTAPGCFTHQRWSATRPCQAFHPRGSLKVKIRFDDECGNRHNTFAITADATHPGGRDIDAGGCLHEEITAVFPELEGLIRWHLCGSDGPMHYLENTMFHAGNKDCWGRTGCKIRELDAARHSAIWPEATDEQLTSPDLKDRLVARLPGLLSEFREMVESIGFSWES